MNTPLGPQEHELFVLTFTLPTVNLLTIPIYEAQSDFEATAGIGSFNVSFVAPMMGVAKGSLSYSILAKSHTLIHNPQNSVRVKPVNCAEMENAVTCDSYLFPGGVQTVLPSPTGQDSSPLVIVYNAPAVQLEFQSVFNSTNALGRNDCTTYGKLPSPVGVQVCVVAYDHNNKGAVLIGEQKQRNKNKQI